MNYLDKFILIFSNIGRGRGYMVEGGEVTVEHLELSDPGEELRTSKLHLWNLLVQFMENTVSWSIFFSILFSYIFQNAH